MLRPLSPEGLKQIPVARVAIPRAAEARAAQARAADPSAENAERARLRQACQDFEAIFLAHLLKRMRDTVPKGGFLSDSREQRLFRDLLDEQLAARLAASGHTGLAEAMYRQAVSRLEPPAATAPEDGTPAVAEPARAPLKPLAGPAEDIE